MNTAIPKPVRLEIVEVKDLPAPKGVAITDPEYIYRWTEQVGEIYQAVLSNPQHEQGWSVVGVLFALFDRSPKEQVEGLIKKLVKGVTSDTDEDKLQELFEIAVKLLAETVRGKQAAPKVAYLPDPYDRKEAETADKANNKVTHGAALAIVAGGKNAEKKVKGWRKNTVNGHPLFPCNQGRDEMTVYLAPDGFNAAELWAKVHNLDALTLDVYLAILAFICDPRNKATYPHVGWFTVNPQQIADMKAFRRYGNDRRVLIGKIVEAVHTISDLRTDFRIHWPGKGKKEQNRMATESGCQLIHIGGGTYFDQGGLF